MKRQALILFLLMAAASWMAGCASRISKETYVMAMSEMGCHLVQENTPAGEALLKEKGVTQAQITDFRKKSDMKDMMTVATEIATKVAACHGVKMPTTP